MSIEWAQVDASARLIIKECSDARFGQSDDAHRAERIRCSLAAMWSALGISTAAVEHKADDQDLHTWKKVCDDDGAKVWRFRVPGGWLYQTLDDNEWSSPTFVPEREVTP